MHTDDHIMKDRLLAYHMGWLSRDEMAELDALIAADARWRECSRALADAIEPLSTWNTLPAVEHLEKQVLGFVERNRAETPTVATLSRLDPVSDPRTTLFRLPCSLKDVVAAAACLGILLAVVLPGLARAAARAQQTVCLDHLRQIGVAQAGYSLEFEDWLPFAGHPGAGLPDLVPSSWLRERTAGVNRLRNSRNRFLLLNQGYLADGGTFVCPSDPDAVVMRFDRDDPFDDFAEKVNCSYDSQIMTDAVKQSTLHPELVIYSDANPLFDPATKDSVPSEQLNSRLHRRLRGQNVLRLDGMGTWASSPNVGVQNDNIWQIGERRNYAGSETLQFPTDSFMIP